MKKREKVPIRGQTAVLRSAARRPGSREERGHYRLLAENTNDVIFLHDTAGKRTYISPSCRRILGYEPEELAILPDHALLHPDEIEEIARKHAELSPERPEFTSVHRIRRKDGRYIWAEALTRLIPGATAAGASIVATVRDITERRKSEDALRESEERFRGSFQTAAHGIALLSPEGRWLEVNPALCRMVGYSEAELLAMNFQSITHPDDLGTDLDNVRAMSAGAIETYQMEKRYFHKNGNIIWVLLSVSLVRRSNGEPSYFVAQIQDITQRKAAEREASRLQGVLTDALEATQDGVALYDADDRLVLANDSLRGQVINGSEVFIAGRTYEAIVHGYANVAAEIEGDYEAFVAEAVEHHRRGDGFPWEVKYRSGQWHLTRHFRTRDGGILTVNTDVTALKAAEAEAVRARTLIIDALEAMRDAVSLYDPDGRLVLANKALLQRGAPVADVFIPGRTFEEMIRGFWDWRRASMSDAVFEDLVADRLEHFRRADGEPYETQSDDGHWFITRHFRTRDGGTISLSADITDTKHAAMEVEAARDAANAANQAKSSFLASMSHEIRTPMNGVIGFADLLLDTKLSDDQRGDVERIRDAGKSLLAIINDILDISKIEAGRLELEQIAMNPISIVDSAVSILRHQITAKGVALSIDHASDIPSWIQGDPVRLRQLLLNLVSNALKFTEAGGIAVRSRRIDGPEGSFLRFEVQDSGIGIPPDRQHLLFQDFSQIDRSTTRRYGGTGLGLSICKRLAEAMGGEIGVTSDLGLGSTFWFTIALVEAAAPARTGEEKTPQSVGPARILVVDDLPMNQIIVTGMLKAEGHEVVVACDGLEAVSAVQQSDYDLVLMDVEMPRMDGIAATRAIRSLRARFRGIPIIALTASAMMEDTAACRAAGMNDFLSKPIDRGELVCMVAKWSTGQAARNHAREQAAAVVLDHGVLENIEALLGQDQAAQFSESCRVRIAQSKDLFSSSGIDRVNLAREAHNLVSVAGNLGCTELMNHARDLATALKNRAPEIGSLSADVVKSAERAVQALEERYPSRAR